MYLQEEREKILTYLGSNKEHIQTLLKDLTTERDRILKEEDTSLHEDIQVEYIGAAKMIIAEDIGKQLGIDAGSILFILDCLGVKGLTEYLE